MKRTSPLLALVVLIAVVVVVAWAVTAILTGDGLWFVPVFSAEARSIELYWDGGHVMLEPGSAGYELLDAAVRQDFAHVKGYPGQVGLSDATLERLYAEGRLLIVRYAQPARIHSWYNFAPSRTYYVPLSGHHAAQSRLFNASRGALELRSIAHIMAAAETVARQEGWVP
jgi:hypothetical protein